MSRDLTYNLPGFGFANCSTFDMATAFFDLLDKHGLIEKLKNTSQLGTMRYVYPGAHHTRYEYVFTQIMLIYNVTVTKGKIQRDVELSLGSELKEFADLDVKATGGDVMQCLAILSNAGHMYDTFTSTKLLTKILQESRNKNTSFYYTYKHNLPRDLYGSFDSLLDTSNYYKLHLYNMIHLLKGMARPKKDGLICISGIELLKRLINPALITNEATKRIFHLYKKIRKIAYLSVDMIYTPASFGINLNHIVYSIPSCIDDLFNEDSPINQSLVQLEDIIHRQIYDSSMGILNTARIEQEKYSDYFEAAHRISNIYGIREIVKENAAPYTLLHSSREPDILKQIIPKSELHLSGLAPTEHLGGILQYDATVQSNMPATRIAFGTQVSQDLMKIYSTFALLSPPTICQDTQTIISKAIAVRLFSLEEKVELIKYAIKSLYKYNQFYFNLVPAGAHSLHSCVLIEAGCKNVAKQIRASYNAENVPDKNQLHEILSCATVLEHISYAGLVLCFIGGIKANQYNKAQKIDELDGLLYFPNRNPSKTFAIIVEAKNYNNGERDAEKQLNDTLPLLSDDLTAKISTLRRCAYVELSIKSED